MATDLGHLRSLRQGACRKHRNPHCQKTLTHFPNFPRILCSLR